MPLAKQSSGTDCQKNNSYNQRYRENRKINTRRARGAWRVSRGAWRMVRQSLIIKLGQCLVEISQVAILDFVANLA